MTGIEDRGLLIEDFGSNDTHALTRAEISPLLLRMRLSHGLHLAYCTNIHRGESWAETFTALQTHTLAVRDRVSAGKPYAIGLRLSAQAARELSDAQTLTAFRHWLDRENCYVFTINGFPYGTFHGARVKEQVYVPDWTTNERVEYTNLLFDLLAQIVPPDVEGSVSTVPCSFKEFITRPEQVAAMHGNLWRSIEHIARVSERTGRRLHLGLEPEPLCFLETSHETVCFIDALRDEHPNDMRLKAHLGVNYDTCHLAVEFEEPAAVLKRFADHDVRVSKLHFSSALKVVPDDLTLNALTSFVDSVYFHQVIERTGDNAMRRFRDLDVVLAENPGDTTQLPREWRIHFHIPLHFRATAMFGTTTDHLMGVMDALAVNPSLCSHIEMETYTWEVMPPEMKNRSVVDQLVSEYEWTLAELAKRGITKT
ncbi:MAG TPA: metabolite traffic protein EboE [Candidatus Acidoferrum sp.]|nr:metabolite traffic protein EboE [Candidatus Acidoferrum sp.]